MFFWHGNEERNELETAAARATRAARSGSWLFALALIAACSSDDTPAQQPPWTPGPLADSGSNVVAQDAASAPAASNDSGASAPVGQQDAGSTPSVDSSTPAPMDSGTPPASGGDSAAPSGDGAAPSGDGAPPSGPVTLPEPDKVGPYVVKEIDNVGKGFENPIDPGDVAGGEGGCALFISLFTSDQMEIDSYAKVPPEYKMDLYTLWYPEGGAPGQRFPVLSWANGTCAHTIGYGDLIKHVVSHGFIVIATHSRQTNGGVAQLRGIDWVFTQDTAMDSPLFGRVNKDQVGVFGHSQGGGSTGVASKDPRVKTSVLMHGGTGSNLHAPAFFLTGEMDNPTGVRSNYDATRVPAAFGNLKMSNHITMMNGKGTMRMAPEVAAWFRYVLNNDAAAKKWFVGADCVLCKDPEWVYAQKDLK